MIINFSLNVNLNSMFCDDLIDFNKNSKWNSVFFFINLLLFYLYKN